MMIRQFLPLACASALLAACNSGADDGAEDTAAPISELTSAPVPTAAPDGTAIVPGMWNVGEDAASVRAVFGEAGSESLLTIVCDTRSRQVTMTYAAPADAPQAVVIEAGGQAAQLDMVPATEARPALKAEIEPTLPIFAAFSQADTVIALTAHGRQKQQFPTHPGIVRVLNGCS